MIAIQNDMNEEMPANLVIGKRMISPVPAAVSFNTFGVPTAGLAGSRDHTAVVEYKIVMIKTAGDPWEIIHHP